MVPTPSVSEVENIAAFLDRRAGEHPDRAAIHDPIGRRPRRRVRYRVHSYRELQETSDRLARGLREAGVAPGTRAALMVRPGFELFSLVFALFKAGVVPVLVDPGLGARNIGRCLAHSRPEVFIGIPQAHLARRLFGWASDSVRLSVTVGPRLFSSGESYEGLRRKGEKAELSLDAPDPDAVAAILFTSGSTGPPKGVVYTHRIFGEQVRTLRDVYGIEPGEVDLPTFPLFALFSPALGMTAVIPRMDFTRPARVAPEEIRSIIERFEVTNLFGSPALLNRVSRVAVAKGWRFPTLRRVISAGAPVSGQIIERFTRLLGAGSQVFTPYGATEALPVCSIGSEEILAETFAGTAEGSGVCVGRPVGDVELEVIGITDDAIPRWGPELAVARGDVGEIAVTGTVVTREYDGLEEANRLAKIRDERGRIWHRMGDVGYRDESGRVWFCGRKSQRVVLAEETLFTVPCEGVFNGHPEVHRTALVGVESPAGPLAVLCVELEEGVSSSRRPAIEAELKERGSRYEHTRRIEQVLFHPRFPVDIRHNAKIFREKLARWAEERLSR